MKKLLSLVVAIALALSMGSVAFANETLKIGATPSPHAEILEFIKDDMAALGYDLDVQVFTDWPLLNPSTSEKEIDANYFQHALYLDSYNKTVDDSKKLVAVIGVHYEPYGIYPGKTKTLEELQDGATITVPNDPSNETRAMFLLSEAGLITLPEDATPGSDLTVLNIENPRGFDIREIEASQLPSTLDDTDIAVINGNYALDAGLNPARDAIFLEPSESEAGVNYTNYIVVHEDNKDAAWIDDLRKVLCSEKVKNFILEKEDYKGGVIPVFTVG